MGEKISALSRKVEDQERALGEGEKKISEHVGKRGDRDIGVNGWRMHVGEEVRQHRYLDQRGGGAKKVATFTVAQKRQQRRWYEEGGCRRHECEVVVVAMEQRWRCKTQWEQEKMMATHEAGSVKVSAWVN